MSVDSALTPLVSVVIPTRDSGDYLRTAIDSVLAQTHKNIEIIVVNDGSTSDISWVEGMPSVRVLNQRPLGISSARNAGILASEGEFVAFLDADDVWKQSKLTRQLEVMASNPEAALCYTRFELIDETGQVTGEGPFENTCSFFDLLKAVQVKTSSVLVRREALTCTGLFDPLLVVAEDVDLFIRLARFHKLIGLDSTETQYRIHGTNISHWGFALRAIADVYERNLIGIRARNETDKLARTERAVTETFSWWHILVSRSRLRQGRLLQFAYHVFLAAVYDRRPLYESIKSWLAKRHSRNEKERSPY